MYARRSTWVAELMNAPGLLKPPVIIVTGTSGAGKSTALRALEDAGFDAVDNPPINLASALIKDAGVERGLAMGVDVRSRGFSTDAILKLLANHPTARLVFLDCDQDVALRRFTETRRRHPIQDAASPAEGIRRERAILGPLRLAAERVIDTSLMNGRDLRRLIQGMFAGDDSAAMRIAIESFSYPKSGAPRDADLVFDVRFLANPHYREELRPLTGRDSRVATFIANDPNFEPFAARIRDLLLFLLPLYEAEGKSYLTVAFGCTGGRHRSVALAEHIGGTLARRGWATQVSHREIEERATPQGAQAALAEEAG